MFIDSPIADQQLGLSQARFRQAWPVSAIHIEKNLSKSIKDKWDLTINETITDCLIWLSSTPSKRVLTIGTIRFLNGFVPHLLIMNARLSGIIMTMGLLVPTNSKLYPDENACVDKTSTDR